MVEGTFGGFQLVRHKGAEPVSKGAKPGDSLHAKLIRQESGEDWHVTRDIGVGMMMMTESCQKRDGAQPNSSPKPQYRLALGIFATDSILWTATSTWTGG
jgi:hypothetical protein